MARYKIPITTRERAVKDTPFRLKTASLNDDSIVSYKACGLDSVINYLALLKFAKSLATAKTHRALLAYLGSYAIVGS